MEKALDFPSVRKPFEDARVALRRLSLYFQHRHERTLNAPYRCPLRRDPQHEKEVSVHFEKIRHLDKKNRERIEALVQMLPPLNTPQGVRWVTPQESEARLLSIVARNKIKKRKTADITAEREHLVNSLYGSHAKTLAALDPYLPTRGGKPITRKEARDTGDYFLALCTPVERLQQRVSELAEDIDKAEERFLRTTGERHLARSAQVEFRFQGTPLKGIKEICRALDLSSTKWRWLRALSEKTKGQLHSGRPGQQLVVHEGPLKQWFLQASGEWNRSECAIESSATSKFEFSNEIVQKPYDIKNRRSDWGKKRRSEQT